MKYKNNFRELRKKLGISKASIHRATGISLQTLNNIDKGDTLPLLSTQINIQNFMRLNNDLIFPKIDRLETRGRKKINYFKK